jgi:hypothetical protein
MIPEQQLDIVAKIIFGEAGSEGGDDLPQKEESLRAIASVLRNRSLISGKSVYEEATKQNADKVPQFSAYAPPDSGLGERDKRYWSITVPANIKVSPKAWAMAQAMARQAIDGIIQDNTGGATFYYNPSITRKEAITPGLTPTNITILNHQFFKDLTTTNPYADSKLQEKLKSLSQQLTKPQADIISQETTIPQQDKEILVGTKKQIKEQEDKKQLETFSEKVGQHSRSPLASERFKKALDAWTLTMNPEQKKTVQDYLPEHFEQETQQQSSLNPFQSQQPKQQSLNPFSTT